jgi:2-amino-4-hydroxy-6-hydroxymethyldihydropteridine diphosphokinase
LGSNLGDRRSYLEEAIRLIGDIEETSVVKRSPIYETEPEQASAQGERPGNMYLNMVVELTTRLTPHQLLGHLARIEEKLGRKRPAPPNADRTIDLDVLFFGDRELTHPDLLVPHPRLQRREFVLRPLADIAPDFDHPVLKKTVIQLRDELGEQRARRLD